MISLGRLMSASPPSSRSKRAGPVGYVSTVLRIQAAFEEAGVEFTDDKSAELV